MRLFFLLFPVFVSFFWAVVLLANSSEMYYPKVFLGKFMIVAFLVNFLHLVFFIQGPDYFQDVNLLRVTYPIYIFCVLVVFPMHYVYLRLLLIDRFFSLSKHWGFFIVPLIFFLLSVFVHLFIGYEQSNTYFTQVFSGNESDVELVWWLCALYWVFRLVFFAQVVFYLFYNVKILASRSRELDCYYSNLEVNKRGWISLFTLTVILVSIVSLVITIFGRIPFFNNDLLLGIFLIVTGSVLFLLGLVGNKQNFVVLPCEGIESIGIEDDFYQDHIEIKNKMDSLFEKDRIFLNPHLKISDLADMLGTNRSYISRIINHVYERNFCSHVNYYRVKYAKSLLSSKNLSKNQVAELAGFGSINSMYRAFQFFENSH